MPTYFYRAAKRDGGTVRGRMSATSKQLVLARLTEAGQEPLEVAELGVEKFDWSRLMPQPGGGANAKALTGVTEQLATLLESGILIDRALMLVARVTTQPRMREAIEAVREAMRGGVKLSEALAAQGKLFPKYFIGLVKAGESGGGHAFAFRQLAIYMKQSQEISARVTSALIYPLILMGMIFVTLLIVFFYVLPQFETIFAGHEDKLPFATQVIIGIGHHLKASGWLYAAAALVGVLGSRWALARPGINARLHRFLIAPSFLFGLPLKMETGRFARIAGTLIRTGVSVPETLAIARAAAWNLHFSGALERAATSVREGGTLGGALGNARILPETAQQMIEIGEQSAQLDTMLLSASDLLDGEVRNTVDRLLAALVPGLTILMGVIVAGVIGSLMIGIVSLNKIAL